MSDIPTNVAVTVLVSTQVSDTPSGITWYKYDVSQDGYILIPGNLIASSSTESVIYLVSNTSFRLLTSEPANWSTNYHSYYQLHNNMYEKVPNASSPI